MLRSFHNTDQIKIFNAYNNHINEGIDFEKLIRDLDLFSEYQIQKILKAYGK